MDYWLQHKCASRTNFMEDNIIRPLPFSFRLPTTNWFGVFVVHLHFWIWNRFTEFKNSKNLKDIQCKIPLLSSNAEGWPFCPPSPFPTLGRYLFLFVSCRSFQSLYVHLYTNMNLFIFSSYVILYCSTPCFLYLMGIFLCQSIESFFIIIIHFYNCVVFYWMRVP